MRHSFVCLALALTSAGATRSSAQVALRASPSSRASSEVTLSNPRAPAPTAVGQPATPVAAPLTIRLDYGQPHLRGRTLHTDSLVPYDKPWRTGANGSTTLKTDVDLVLGGVSVPKGTYVLFTLPGRGGWKLLLQRSAGQAPLLYDQKNDVARIDLRRSALATPIESLTMWLIPSLGAAGPARGELRIAWGTEMLSTDWTVK